MYHSYLEFFLRKTVTKIVSWVWLQCEDCSHATGIISYTYIVVVSLLFQMWEERSWRQNIRHSWTKSSALLSGATERWSSQRGIKTHSLYFSFHSLKSSLSFLFSLQLGTCLVFSGALLPFSLLIQASVFCLGTSGHFPMGGYDMVRTAGEEARSGLSEEVSGGGSPVKRGIQACIRKPTGRRQPPQQQQKQPLVPWQRMKQPETVTDWTQGEKELGLWLGYCML